MGKQTGIKIALVIAALLLAAAVGLLCWRMYQEKSERSGSVVEATENGLKLTFSSTEGFDYENYDPSAAFDENTGYWSGITASDYVALPEDLAALSVNRSDITPTEAEVAAALEGLLERYDTSAIARQTTDRACENGDSVNFDYSGTVDGVLFQGGTATGTDLTLGSGGFIPGFEEQLVGHTPGEEFDITVTFPEGYHDSTDEEGNAVALSGKEAVFHIKLNYINTIDLTDEWVAANLQEGYGVATVEALNDYLVESLTGDNKLNAALNALLTTATFSGIPQAIINSEVSYLLYYYSYYAALSQTTLEAYAAAMGYADVTALLNANAEDILGYCEQYLLCQALAETYEITVTDEQLAAYESAVSSYGKGYVMNGLLSTNALQYVAERMTVTE